MMTNKVIYTDAQLIALVKRYIGRLTTNLSIDWLYNPKKAISEKAVLYTIDGYAESITARQLINIDQYGINAL